MPFSKKVKDQEGAIAEAIGTEIAFLSGINHPVVDGPSIIIEQTQASEIEYSVVLPAFAPSETLLDKLFDNKLEFLSSTQYEPNLEMFLKSFGATVAFNWYIGQGDFNTTNVSVCGDKCYPFDFDCGFQSLQSEKSFAKTRVPEFVSVDFDALNQDISIIKGAVGNLHSANKIMGLDSGSLPLISPEKLVVIQQGFQEQLAKILQIEHDAILVIVEKHNPENKDEYIKYIDNKNEQIDYMIKAYANDSNDLFNVPAPIPIQLARDNIAQFKAVLIEMESKPDDSLDSTLENEHKRIKCE